MEGQQLCHGFNIGTESAYPPFVRFHRTNPNHLRIHLRLLFPGNDVQSELEGRVTTIRKVAVR